MRRSFTLLLFALATTLSIGATAAPAVMRYKMVAVEPELWIDPRRTGDVARQIDQIVACGFNTVSIGTFKFMPMYFVDYTKTKYPEASEYPPRVVADHVSTLRANIRLAKSKGIQLFISRSYQHYAPYRFWQAHQAELNPGGLYTPLLEKAHQNDIYFNTLRGKDRIIPQQQWNNPTFRDFFLDSTAAMLDALPELDGFLNAYAEAAWTYKPEALKANQWTNWKDAVDYPATRANFVDYTTRLYHLLVSKRGANAFFGLRDWYITPDDLAQVPVPRKHLLISVKYAGFDEPLINYPPWGQALLQRGYGVILDIHEFDAEHPHPIYWYSRDIVIPTFEHIYEGGFDGIMYQGFAGKGKENDDPIRLLTNRTVGAAMNRKPFAEQNAIEFLRPYYGSGSSDLLRSLESVAFAQAELIKLCPAWFWQGDGLTAGGPQTLKFWMLKDNPDAPPGMAFVRQDVVGVPEYVEAMRAGPAEAERRFAAWRAAGKKLPPDVLAEMNAASDRAIEDILKARAETPPNAPFLQDIVASAFLHRQMVLRDTAFVRAAIAFYSMGARYDGKYVTDPKGPFSESPATRAECLRNLDEIVVHNELLRELELHFAPRRPTTRERHDYAQEKKVAAILGATLTVPPLDRGEYDRECAIILNRAQR